MSEGPNQVFGEKMAIPEGGAHEEMDVSYHSDESPGYVSIKTKGPGRPINIRIGGKVQTLSQFIEANTSRPPVSNEYIQNQLIPAQPDDELDKRSDEFLDKKTGHAVTFDNVSPETVSSLNLLETSEHKEPEQSLESISTKLQESDKKNAQQDSGFNSQSEVVSLTSTLSRDQAGMIDSPAKKKYRLCQEKQKIGTKKTRQGKDGKGLRLYQRQEPYPTWMSIPLKEIQGCCVEIEGKKHRVQVKLIPVENESQTSLQTEDMVRSDFDPTVLSNIHAEGSIDRPPDASLSLEQGRDQTSAVYPVASTQSSTNNQYNDSNILHNPGYLAPMTGIVSAPDIYGNAHDQPLDLTIVKPLDLSKKEESGNILQENKPIPVQGNEEVDSFEPSDTDSASMNVRAETNITEYRIRCPSVASIGDREAELVDESYETDIISGQSQNYSEQNSVSDGNLPSLGRLTLESNSKSQKFAIQDSSVKQEIENTVSRQRTTQSGQQHIVDLIAGGQVSFQQLVELYRWNQLQKSANVPQHSAHLASVKHELNPIQQQQLQPHVVLPQVDNAEGEQDIPTPAMPNLCSLELANTEGGMFETEQERVRNKLKNKLKQKQNM